MKGFRKAKLLSRKTGIPVAVIVLGLIAYWVWF